MEAEGSVLCPLESANSPYSEADEPNTYHPILFF
jgi:hypothetical protein